VSKGPGVWQKEILRVTSGVCVATVSGIVRARLPEPHRDAFVAARRGARGLALAQRVSAVYAYACVRCGQIQDRDDPVACCGSVRPMLAVCQPERRGLLLHPAPPPGGRAPSWINVAVVPPCPQGQFPVPGIADLAALALRRCYERLEAGTIVSAHDVVALLKLAREIEHDAARQDVGNDARWQAALKEVLWLARRHLGEGWKPFAADLHASGTLNLLWGPPPPRPGRPAAGPDVRLRAPQ
jgi:hypothetical protein